MPRDSSDEDLKAQYKKLAREWHPDRHQGAGRQQAEERFQLISEAFQTLANPESRVTYDAELDAAKDAAARAAAARGFRAASWNTKVPDMKARIQNAKKEEPGLSPHFMAGTLLIITANFYIVFNWLAG